MYWQHITNGTLCSGILTTITKLKIDFNFFQSVLIYLFLLPRIYSTEHYMGLVLTSEGNELFSTNISNLCNQSILQNISVTYFNVMSF